MRWEDPEGTPSPRSRICSARLAVIHSMVPPSPTNWTDSVNDIVKKGNGAEKLSAPPQSLGPLLDPPRGDRGMSERKNRASTWNNSSVFWFFAEVNLPISHIFLLDPTMSPSNNGL